MPSINEFPIEPLRQGFNQSKTSLARKLKQEWMKSQDSLTLKTLDELNRMPPPRMGRLERFMSFIRGTEDKIKYPGNVKLRNFAKVDDTVYRGAMPESGKEFEKLKNAYNVRVIVDLRGGETTPKEAIEFGRQWAKYQGIQYVHLPMNSHKAPNQEELTRFFQVIESAKANGVNVYVHCKHGIDRTGSLIAAYETKLGHPPEKIYARMKRRGYNLLHKKTRPAQRDFVKGADLKAKVAAAEAQRVKTLLPSIKPSESLFKMMDMTEPESR